MTYEKIVSLFDTTEHAEAARRNLESAGFPGSEISLVSNKTLNQSGPTLREPGLWHRMFGRAIEEHEASVYGRVVEGGGVVLTVRVRDTDTARAMGILNAHKVVDVRNRAIEYGLLPSSVAAAASAKLSSSAPVITSAISKDQVLRLAEEQLNVGKRLVQEGTTHIRRFVTEKPVEAQVTLHEEHASVVRRAVSDPSYVKDIDWTDATIDVEETAEEAVVSKSARIAEEVVVSKTGTERVETVRDTVRRQQVEVERVGSKPVKKAG